jgi:hypothetical protein
MLTNDECCLAELGIQSGATLQLNLRLPGGTYARTDPKLVELAKSYCWNQLICRCHQVFYKASIYLSIFFCPENATPVAILGPRIAANVDPPNCGKEV